MGQSYYFAALEPRRPPLHHIAIVEDITERKKAETSLKLFRTLLDQSFDAIEVLDPETGRFLDVNAKGCLDLGYTREEFLGLRVFDIDPLVSQSNFPEVIERVRRSGALIWEGIHRRKDGSTFPVEVSIKYVVFDRNYLVAVVRDITERKKQESELAKKVKDLEVFHKATVGREKRIIELKEQLRELKAKLGVGE